jgi:hypothetical protein
MIRCRHFTTVGEFLVMTGETLADLKQFFLRVA